MKFVSLGTSGIHVSRICLGTMTFGSPLNEAKSGRLVSLALDHGINFFDTADVYEGYSRKWGSAGGVSEAILGKALEGRREQAVICTALVQIESWHNFGHLACSIPSGSD
ncbi:MAG: aldo/keto reductase [Bryobacteraceae bacterium]